MVWDTASIAAIDNSYSDGPTALPELLYPPVRVEQAF
jgi:hypothetical protein